MRSTSLATMRWRVVADAKAWLPAGLPEAQRVALELVADGVVERYS